MAKTPNKPNSRVLEALKNHPEKIQIDFGGKRDFLLCAYGAKVLRERGHDPIPVVLDALRGLAPVFGNLDGKKKDGMKIIASLIGSVDPKLLSDICYVIWWGLVSYDADITLDEVEVYATPKSLYKVVEEVYAQMSSFASDEEEATAGGESGN